MTWPDCSPPSVAPEPLHLLEHVLVADRRAHHPDALALQRLLEPEVRHHGRDHHIAGRRPAVAQCLRGGEQHRVAVLDRAAAGDEDGAVGVAVEGRAEIRPLRDHFAPEAARGAARRSPG